MFASLASLFLWGLALVIAGSLLFALLRALWHPVRELYLARHPLRLRHRTRAGDSATLHIRGRGFWDVDLVLTARTRFLVQGFAISCNGRHRFADPPLVIREVRLLNEQHQHADPYEGPDREWWFAFQQPFHLQEGDDITLRLRVRTTDSNTDRLAIRVSSRGGITRRAAISINAAP